MIIYSIYLLFVIIISVFLKKKGVLLNFSGDIHQSFSNVRNVPLSGGIFLLFPVIFLYQSDLIFIFFLSAIFLIGFFSDRKILVSPKKRFFFQIILILLFVIASDLKIVESRINMFDTMLSNGIFAYFFFFIYNIIRSVRYFIVILLHKRYLIFQLF